MEEAIFEKLRVYKEAILFTKEVYLITKTFPRSELFNLTSQFNRAAVSIVLNIAESQGKQTAAEKRNFLYIAKGSAYEVIALIEVLEELKLITVQHKKELREKVFSIIKQINSLINFNK